MIGLALIFHRHIGYYYSHCRTTPRHAALPFSGFVIRKHDINSSMAHYWLLLYFISAAFIECQILRDTCPPRMAIRYRHRAESSHYFHAGRLQYCFGATYAYMPNKYALYWPLWPAHRRIVAAEALLLTYLRAVSLQRTPSASITAFD